MSELGPASKALLDRITESFGYGELGALIYWAKTKTGYHHSEAWWYRRIVALALEGYIEAKVYRNGDDVALRFRRRQEDEN